MMLRFQNFSLRLCFNSHYSRCSAFFWDHHLPSWFIAPSGFRSPQLYQIDFFSSFGSCFYGCLLYYKTDERENNIRFNERLLDRRAIRRKVKLRVLQLNQSDWWHSSCDELFDVHVKFGLMRDLIYVFKINWVKKRSYICTRFES